MSYARRTFICALGCAALILPLSAGAQSPYLLLNPYSGFPNSTVAATGFNFGFSQPVTLQFGSFPTVSATTDTTGRFSVALSVPETGPASVTIRANAASASAAASYYVSGYYPNAFPSSYYLLPNQTVTFRGEGFAPNESVSIRAPDDSGTFTFTADAGGNFSNQAAYTIPFSFAESQRTFTVVSSKSGRTISITTHIGTFYPNLFPSSYYVMRGQSMSASASGFAPSESVELLIDGAAAGSRQADASGNVSWTFTAPVGGSTFTLSAHGLSSHTFSSRTLTLAQ